MISRTKTGRSFGGLARYLVQGRKGQEENKQAEILAAEGVRTDTIAHLIADFNRGRRVNPGLGQAVWHTSLSFNPDDAGQLDSEKMRVIAEDWMQEMGLGETQFVVIRHRDKPGHEHLHIVANRVANDGHTISDSHNFYKSKQVLTQLIQKYELTPPQGMRVAKQRKPLDKAELAKYEIRQVLAATLATATDGRALNQELGAAGITAKVFHNAQGTATGISFAKDGLTFKGSELGRQYSFAGIGKQIAANRQAQQLVAASTASIQEQSVEITQVEQVSPPMVEKAGREQAREWLRQVLAEVLASATDGKQLAAGLRSRNVGWQVQQDVDSERKISFALGGHTFQGIEIDPAYSVAGMQTQLTANREARPAAPLAPAVARPGTQGEPEAAPQPVTPTQQPVVAPLPVSEAKPAPELKPVRRSQTPQKKRGPRQAPS